MMCETCKETAEEVRKQKGVLGNVLQEIGKSSSNAHNAAINTASMKGTLEQFIKTSDVRYTTGLQEHRDLWNGVNEALAFKNKWLGIIVGVSFVVSLIWTLALAYIKYGL